MAVLEARSLFFTAPGKVELRATRVPAPGKGQVRIRAERSGISAGTEMLVYRGQAPPSLVADTAIAGLVGDLSFPLQYGYSVVGRVEAVGPEVEGEWLGRRVFVFHPHQSHFLVRCADLTALPEDVDSDTGVFLPNLETAVNLLHDGCPLLGERVVVFGQGVVGLLTGALLSRFPLSELVTVDPVARRRFLSAQLGARRALDPADLGSLSDFDLSYEVSGRPATLNDALAATGFSGRVIVGSWYGTKTAPIELGGSFHRSRIRIVSSQVSTVAPQLSGRWSKARRLQGAVELLAPLQPSRLITHHFPFEEAAAAYDLLDRRPEEVVQIVLTYD